MKTLKDLTVTSQFVGIGQRKSDDNFKGNYKILYPIHTVVINGERFEYSSSPVDLGKMYGLQSSGCLYLKDNGGVYQSMGYAKRSEIRGLTLDRLTAKMFTAKNRQLAEDEKLYAFRCVVSDALTVYENRDIGEFADAFGYTDIKETLRIWNACNDTKMRLAISAAVLYELLDELSEMGIE